MGMLRLAGMSIERMRSWFWSLTKIETLMAMSIVTITSLLLFRLPIIKHFRGIYFNDSLQYALIIIFVLTCVLIVKPPTMVYFRWPRIRWIGAFALLAAIGIVALAISNGYMIKQPLRFKVAGVISLLFIGFGEELLSRILVFGSLQRFGTRFAVLVSSAMFGLMHLNVYIPEWSFWAAFSHVASAFSFGIFACALLLATRSYWIVAIFHGLADWTVVFDRKSTSTGEDYSPSIFEGLRWILEGFFMECGIIGLILLWVMRGKWPKWAIRLAIKWKLVEQAEALS